MHRAEPVDAIRAFHNAFRIDLKRIDVVAFDSAKGKQDSPGFEIFNADFFTRPKFGFILY